jgi:Cu/Ag efflux protein CusF
MIVRAALVLMLAFALSGVSSALAGEQFAGEVLKVDVAAHKLTVKKADGNRFTFTVDGKTAFAGSRKSLNDLAKGDQVTVEFQTGGGQYTALRVSTP